MNNNIPSRPTGPIRRLLALALAGGLATAPPLWAHSANDATANRLLTQTRQAALIAYGKVVDIQYRNSEPTKAQPKGVPHTFVTYELQTLLRGGVDSKTLTLRVPGGGDGQGGAFLETTAPTFALGQTDVVFVKGGDISGCQLVDCVEGRFRVVDKQVYNGWGVPVVEALPRLRMGGKPRFDLNVMELPRPAFQTVAKRPDMAKSIERLMAETGLSLAELEAKYNEQAPNTTLVNLGHQAAPVRRDSTFEPAAKPMHSFGPPLTLEQFFDAVRTLDKQLGAPTTEVRPANADARFAVPDPRPAAPKASTPPKADVSDEERLDTNKGGAQ